jgi:hypothetical protein
LGESRQREQRELAGLGLELELEVISRDELIVNGQGDIVSERLVI